MSMNLGDLIKGILVIIGIALATGQYGTLHHFAKKEAASALRGWRNTPSFFPAGYEVMKNAAR